MGETITVMLCGVGGQGTILAADLLARAAAEAGLKVKLSEVHGMAQRGGSVNTVVRFGEEVEAPVADPGNVDALVAFELLEAVRHMHYLKPGGKLFVNATNIDPLSVRTGAVAMPTDIENQLQAVGATFVRATDLAARAGSPRSANVVLMGALSAILPFEEDVWVRVIEKRVPPKTIEANREAFRIGRLV